MTDEGNVGGTLPSQAHLASRAIVSTGMAYPIGVMLGATFGVLLGDLLFAMVCFIFVPVPLTMVVFWRTTRNIDWSWQLQRTAYLRVFSAAFIATGLVMAGPAALHRAPHLFQPRHPCGEDRGPCAGRRRPARAVAGRAGRHARAHRRDAGGAARPAVGPGAGARLRLRPQPARHVQLHRPERAPRSTSCARSMRST